MSEETIKEVLSEFGLTERETEVYIFLAKHDVQKGGEISKQLKMPTALVYRILKNLEKKGVVESTLESPVRFTAVPFETILELSIKAKRDEAELIEKRKSSLLQYWRRISKTPLEPEPAKFVVIEGNRRIYRKIAEMVEKAQSNFSAIVTVSDLMRSEQFGILDSINVRAKKLKEKFHFLIDLSKKDLKAVSLLIEKLEPNFDIRARNPVLALALFPRIVIRDSEEILLFISPKNERSANKQNVCIYTDCWSIVQAFTSVFEELWRTSTRIEEKMAEIKAGKPTPATLVITDEEVAKEKYGQIVNAAENEIVIMTSARDLVLLSKKVIPIEDLSKRNISIRIMAPIINENLSYAEKLSKYCEIRHVATSYQGTTLVDSKHLFQLRASSPNQEDPEQLYSFENAFYTTDSTYVQKIKNTIEDTWNNSYPLSTVALSPALRSHTSGKRSMEEKRDLKTLPERLLKAAQIHKSLGRAVIGEIIISPPSHLNMPDTRICAMNFDKESSHGEGDMLRVDLWLNTPKGEIFVPVAIVTDACPEIVAIQKEKWEGTPAGENILSVNPEELQVWSKGKTLFAGWTKPIPLVSPKYKLDPACILFEAFGDELHLTTSHALPSGWVMGTEWDGFQAFTTYIGTSWKYSGPGISGTVGKMIFMESAPKKGNKISL